jgi:hypothetical protein
VESVVADVRQDEVAAAVKMRDERVGLEGRIKEKGLKTEKVAEASTGVVAAPFGYGRTKVELKDKNLGFIELVSTTAEPAKAMCLFDTWALKKLANVREGQTVRIVCRFAKVEGEPGNRVPVFDNCFVDD